VRDKIAADPRVPKKRCALHLAATKPPTPHTLNPTPYTLHLKSRTLTPEIVPPKPYTLTPNTCILHLTL